ncbi:transglutaminase family protein [Paenibacillus dakarensis]|uniref:transglutaminase family protein n=1 Tax=Paenibacillus dakarensis TaxID=1527293 RepID=UPI0006D572C9|nr:transglutaminase domain-containing protein [Paenibacillus dakarensis]
MANFSSLSDKAGSDTPAAGVPGRFRKFSPSSFGSIITRLLITLPIFGLFMEWLLPLQGLGGDQSPMMLDTLLVLAVILLLQGLFAIRGWVWLPLNILSILLLWGRLFDAEHPLMWLLSYVTEVLPVDAGTLTERWLFNDLSNETRALILLFGWSVMVSAVHTLALHRRTIWLFGGTTISYLAAMEVVLEDPLAIHMFRSICCILISQGLMLLLKLKNEEYQDQDLHGRSNNIRPRVLLGWAASILMLTAALTSIVRTAGEYVPAKTGSEISVFAIVDQFQEWTSGMSRINKNLGASMSGYDSLGAEMGGPMTLGKDLFFTAETPAPTYWRGESLAYYDGRRWISNGHAGLSAEVGEDLSDIMRAPDREAKPIIEQKIILEAPYTAGIPLFSGGSVIKITEVNGLDGRKLKPVIYTEPRSGNLYFKDEVPGIGEYRLETELQASAEKLQQHALGPDPEAIMNTYLQLPDSLPQRVRDMAKNITAGFSGRYEKAEAVKSYLQREYTYTLKTKIPPAGEDFTDHFLFDFREGYCTHFATSMVVLLRAQGIPSRYVMGFAPGEKVQGTEQTYRVTQEEAHAWVEVYFPGEGWISFDPTPGLNIGTDSRSEQEGLPAQSSKNSSYRLIEMLKTLGASIGIWFADQEPMRLTAFALFFLPLLLLGAGAMLRGWRRPVGGRKTSETVTERDQLTLASERVWKQIEKRYGAMKPGITVKKYIHSLYISDDDFRAEIERFASRWEQIAYRKEPLSRTEKNLFLRQCRTIVKKRV